MMVSLVKKMEKHDGRVNRLNVANNDGEIRARQRRKKTTVKVERFSFEFGAALLCHESLGWQERRQWKWWRRLVVNRMKVAGEEKGSGLKPLSSNLYYVIRRKGKRQGEASTSSKEEDMGTYLCCIYIQDVKERPLNPSYEYQQYEIRKKHIVVSKPSLLHQMGSLLSY
ncbi:hypothetical protein K1719_032309 [Acacia pycnantha]|nr:hypothetical protein K1719_032309 [Acacia pycnantha]